MPSGGVDCAAVRFICFRANWRSCQPPSRPPTHLRGRHCNNCKVNLKRAAGINGRTCLACKSQPQLYAHAAHSDILFCAVKRGRGCKKVFTRLVCCALCDAAGNELINVSGDGVGVQRMKKLVARHHSFWGCASHSNVCPSVCLNRKLIGS
jgi:hypothetical protein